jgi:gamma-glutamyl:cysteine ligase YbdK (ATP-grasp superfamily)
VTDRPTRDARRSRPYRLFEVVGLEIEYPIVDRELRPRCLVEAAFRALAGRPASEVDVGAAGFSNELAAHVFEVKTLAPQPSLARTEAILQRGVEKFSAVLGERFGARLLPTGMHPLMRPSQTTLWPRAGREIYRAYARLFPVRGHGWLNVQSCHVNLPFGSEQETALLHNAIACLLPYLPALAASSPLVAGRLGPAVDNRLAFYATNQSRVPAITAGVVPEYMRSYAQYRREILRPIYRRLARSPAGRRLCHEWVNSRGAILRFQRRAIEIRVLDTQECVKMDVAVAAFVRAALRRLTGDLGRGRLSLPAHATLVDDFRRVVAAGTSATVRAPHLTPARGERRVAVRELLLDLLADSLPFFAPDERAYAALVRERLRRGNLSERIRRSLNGGGRGKRPAADAVRALYGELADCLARNVAWDA